MREVADVSKRRYPLTPSEISFHGLGYVALFLFGMLCVIPFYLIAISSFADESALVRNGFELIPEAFSLNAYKMVFTNPARIGRAYFNTILTTVVGTTLSLLLSTLTGYVLSRKDFKWRNGFSFFFFFTTLFSGGLIPGYLNVKDLGLINSLWSLILPGAISTYNLIIMKTAFASVPDALPESAQIDGARHLTILARIMVPLSAPTIAVLVLYYAVGHWNAWFSASIYLQDSTLHPLQLVMRNILNSADVSEMLGDVGGEDQARYVELIKYALIMVSTVPILVLYPFLQKYFVKGVMIGAIKG